MVFRFLQKAQEKEIELLGVEKLKYFNFNAAVPTLNMKVGTGIDWFDVEIEVDYNGLVVPLSELKKAILNQQKYIPLTDGSLGVIPPEWILKYSYLFKSGKWKDNKLQVSKFQWTLIDELYNELTDEKIGEELKRKKSYYIILINKIFTLFLKSKSCFKRLSAGWVSMAMHLRQFRMGRLSGR